MTTTKVSATSSESALRRAAYSFAARTSWIEHGPTTRKSRGSRRPRIAQTVSRPDTTVRSAAFDKGSAAFTCSGVGNSSCETTFTLLMRFKDTPSERSRPLYRAINLYEADPFCIVRLPHEQPILHLRRRHGELSRPRFAELDPEPGRRYLLVAQSEREHDARP